MKKKYNFSYYEPFAGYEGSKKDLMALWNMSKGSGHKMPTKFYSAVVPMAGKVGKKGK